MTRSWIPLLVFCSLVSANGQTAVNDAGRPKIGLVLEGGGALGLAHIGVLEWLETNRVPIDYVAGTSMGGLVGGLYASGKSPGEIRRLIQSIDWPATIRGDTPFSDLSFRRKEDRLAYPNRLEFGLRDGFSVPDGINAGHQIGLILNRATLAYSDVKSFDDLPIPFRCVAVEMMKGEEVVFDRGDLAVALRSTMSISGVFSPSRDGDRIFTDGGTLNNLPVDIAKRMGADIVIAVLLRTPPIDKKVLNSIGGVLGRTVDVVISANEMRNIKAADILITIDLPGYAGWDYDKGKEIADRGVAASESKKSILSRFALGEGDFKAHLSRRQARTREVSPKPAFFDVQGTSRPDLAKSIEQTLEPHLNKPLDYDEFEESLTRVVGFGRFQQAGYRFKTRDGSEGLTVKTVEKVYGPPFLNLGFNIDGIDTADVRFDATARLTFVDIGAYRHEWRTDLQFGGRYGVRSEYYVPFSAASKWFVAPYASVRKEPFRIYDGSDLLATYGLATQTVGGDLGLIFNRFAELRVGQGIGWFTARKTIGNSLLPEVDDRKVFSKVTFQYEGLDDPVVARKGLRTLAELEYISNIRSGVDSYPVLRSRIEYYHPVTRKGSWFVAADAGTVFGASEVFFPPFVLGGPRAFGAYGQNEIRATEVAYGTAGWVQELFRVSPILGDRAFLLGFYQAGKTSEFDDSRNPQNATGLLVFKTMFGPVFLGASIGDAAHKRWYFGMGRVF